MVLVHSCKHRLLLSPHFSDELYGDFVDLETGEVHHGKDNQSDNDDDNMSAEEDEEETKNKEKEEKKEMTDKEKRLEKKRKLKEMFDADYDDQEGANYFDDLKQQMEEQAKVRFNQRLVNLLSINPNSEPFVTWGIISILLCTRWTY